MSSEWTSLRKHWADSSKAEPTFGLPAERELMAAARPIAEALRELGWQPAIYCPKDGTTFLGWEFPAGSPGLCYYDGEWPTGSWWMLDAGDIWPVRPTLFRPLTAAENDMIEAHR